MRNIFKNLSQSSVLAEMNDRDEISYLNRAAKKSLEALNEVLNSKCRSSPTESFLTLILDRYGHVAADDT